MAIPEIALRLDQNSHAYAELYEWANHPDANVAAIFPATLLLHERLNKIPSSRN